MNEEKLQKTLNVTKKGKLTVWAYTSRYTSINAARCGYSSTICYPDGKQTRIILTLANYTKVKHLVRIYPDSLFIQAREDIEGTTVEIYKTDKIDEENKKVYFSKVASFKNNKWDDSSYAKICKQAISSVKMRAKKYYSLIDMK